MPTLSQAAPQRKAERAQLPNALKGAIKMGWSIIPVGIDKRPLLESWKQFQTTPATPEKIEEWHTKGYYTRSRHRCRPAGWAVVTGKVSGILILDFDGEKGAAALERLKLRPHVRTGSGGAHVYFRHPGFPVKTLNSKTSARRLADWAGVDIRADGGYAVYTGRNQTGEYKRLRPFDPLPWIQELPHEFREAFGLLGPDAHKAEQHPAEPQPQRVALETLVTRALARVSSGSGRNDAGMWFACQARDNGYSESETAAADYPRRVPTTNAKGAPEPYTVEEYRATVAQAFRTAPREPWKAPAAKRTPKAQPTAAEPAAAKPAQAEPPAPAAAPAPPEKETDKTFQAPRFKGTSYDETPDGLLYWAPAREGGRVARWLTNFTARITADLVMDDGAEQTRALKIVAKRGNQTKTFNLPASNFKGMDWPIEHLGSSAIVYPQFATHAATAIQVMSGEKPELFLYRHTGWRVVDGQHVYLHASGAIGANGPVDVETQLDGGLSKAELPAPADPVATRAAIRASLEMIHCAPHAITLPLYAAIWRSVLGAAPFSIHLYGETGSGKSALAAIVQQHFGARFHQLPEAWASTANALQAATFNAKDFLLTIDEFKPGGSAADHNKWHEKAELVFRAQGNSAGKTRMKADTTLRAAKEPRGLILSTGEDVPRGNSLRARLVVLEMTRQCMVWHQLTACQEQARKGVYAQAMAGYLQWLAPQMATLPERIATMQAAMRAATVDTQAHRRTPDNLFNLSVGISMFCEYAQAFKAMTKAEAARLIAMTQEVMTESAQVQARQQAQAEPTGLFVEMLKAAVASGRAHYANMSGEVPQNPAAFGWRNIGGDWHPQGKLIGWLNDDEVLLLPPAAYGVAQEVAAGVNETITLSLQTLKKRMKERHMLVRTDTARETATIRKIINGQNHEVLHTSIPRLYGAEPDKPDNLKRKAAPLSGSGVGL